MMGHKICFYGEIWLIIPKLSLLPLLIWSTGEGFDRNSEINFVDFSIYPFQTGKPLKGRALDKREYLIIIFSISHQNHML